MDGTVGPGDREGRGRHRRILALALPATGTLIADPLLGLVDTAVVGRLGAAPLGAMGLGISVLALATWAFNFLAYGTTAAVARAVGAGDHVAAGRRTAHAGRVALGLGLVVGAVIAIGAGTFISLLDAVPSVADEATTYLRIRALGVPFILLTYVGSGTFYGLSDTRTTLAITVVANAINAGLDVLLVLHLDVGLAGAAWATVAAEVTSVVLYVALSRRTALELRGHGRPTRTEIGALVRVSRDLVVRTGSLLLALMVVAAAAARIGAVTAAAHQVLWQVWITGSFLLDGFAIAAQAMIGTALGDGDEETARETARDLLRWGAVGGVLVGGVMLAFPTLLPRILTDDAEVLAAVAGVWWLAAGGHLVNGVLFVLDGVFIGAGDFAYLRTWTATAVVPAIAVALFAPSLGGGLLVLWIGIEAMLLIRLVSLVVRLRGRAWLSAGQEVVAPPR